MTNARQKWVEVPLTELVKAAPGGLWGRAPDDTAPDPVIVRVVRGAEFRSWHQAGFASAPLRRIAARALATRQLNVGDLVLEVSGGGPRQPVGRVVLVDRVDTDGPPLIPSNFCRRLVLVSSILPNFLRYQLTWQYEQGATERHQTASTNIRNLNVTSFLEGTRIVLPPLPDQERIVSAIEEEFSRIDAGRMTLDAIECRAARIVHYVVDETLKRERWSIVKMGTLLTESLANGRSVRDGDGYPVLRLDAISAGTVDVSRRKAGGWTYEEGRRFRVRAGDFLVVRGNGTRSLVGRGGLVGADAEVAYPDTLIRIRVDENRIDPRYLQLVWDGSRVREQIEQAARTTAGIYKINQGHIEATTLPLPSLVRQQALVEHVAVIRNAAGPGLVAVRRARARSGQLRSAILGAAFAGRLA